MPLRRTMSRAVVVWSLGLAVCSTAGTALCQELATGADSMIEIALLKAITTKEPQVFFVRGSIRNGVLTMDTSTVGPDKLNPPGDVFGIIEYRITNKSKDKVDIKYKDIHVTANGVPQKITGQAIVNSSPAFGFGIGYSIGGGQGKTDRIIFAFSIGDAGTSVLQYEGLAPISLAFQAATGSANPGVPKQANHSDGTSGKPMATAVMPQPENREKTKKDPRPLFSQELEGRNPVRVVNPNGFSVAVGIRSGPKGKDFDVSAKGVQTVYIPNGKYNIFFVYSDRPDALFEGDSFALNSNGVEIRIVQVVNGNYPIRQVK